MGFYRAICFPPFLPAACLSGRLSFCRRRFTILRRAGLLGVLAVRRAKKGGARPAAMSVKEGKGAGRLAAGVGQHGVATAVVCQAGVGRRLAARQAASSVMAAAKPAPPDVDARPAQMAGRLAVAAPRPRPARQAVWRIAVR